MSFPMFGYYLDLKDKRERGVKNSNRLLEKRLMIVLGTAILAMLILFIIILIEKFSGSGTVTK